MQNTQTTETAGLVVFENEVTTKAGGIGLATTDLVNTTVVAGTPVGPDANGLFHVCKTAKMQDSATNSATDYKVLKGHNFKVGDIISHGLLKHAWAITAITTTEADYDTISTGTTLGVALTTSDVLIHCLAEVSGNTSAWKYTPYGLVLQNTTITSGDTPTAACVVACAAVREANCPPLNADLKTALKVIRFI